MTELSLDLIWLILRANLVLGAAILIVLALRGPARRWFGARLAYALWFIPLLAAAAVFAPARVEHVTVYGDDAAQFSLNAPVASALATGHTDLPPILLLAWAGGVLFCVMLLTARQSRFSRALGRLSPRDDLGPNVYEAESARLGPAVIGVLRPIIVTPADFERRFSAQERSIMLAHERAHMAQGDPLINGLAALLQCLNWFNPLIHVALRALRTDQELACDAAVVASADAARRPYAEAMLKTQLSATEAPLACAWPSANPDSLKERISMLKRTLPSRAQRLLGASAIAAVSIGACAAAWSAQPARVEVTTAPLAPVADVAPVTAIAPVAAVELTPTTAALAPIAMTDPELADFADPALKAERARQRLAQNDADIELDGADIQLVGGRTPQARRDADRDRNRERHVTIRERDLTPQERARIHDEIAHAMAEARNARMTAEQRAELRADIARAMAAERSAQLTAEQQAHIQERVEQAMERSREVMERTAVRMRDVERRVALRDSERHVTFRDGREVEMTPEMRAELDAVNAASRRVSAEAARLAHQNNSPEMQAARAELQQHAQRLRELAQQARARADEDEHVAPQAQHD